MKHSLIKLIFIFFGTSAFCQFEHPELYYPENIVYAKNKVNTVIDSAIYYSKPFIMAYDTLGRIISAYYEGDSTPTQYKYHQIGDTLFRYEYTIENSIEKIYVTERFVYNNNGDILSYQSIRKNYFYQDQSDCTLHEFIYSDKGELLFFHYYINENYPVDFTPRLRVDVNQMDI